MTIKDALCELDLYYLFEISTEDEIRDLAKKVGVNELSITFGTIDDVKEMIWKVMTV